MSESPLKQNKGDLLSECCKADFYLRNVADPDAFPVQEVCSKCEKDCEVVWSEVSNNA